MESKSITVLNAILPHPANEGS
jgi:hypothetical protein